MHKQRPIRFLTLAAGLAFLPLALSAQSVPPCQARALKTVADARSNAVRRNAEAAAKLLDQADRECGASFAVLNGIAGVYQLLGNASMSDLYARNANRYSSQRPAVARAKTAPSSTEAKTFVRDKFALIVGIGSFQRKGLRPLQYAAKDATDFAALLTDPAVGRFHPANVTVLTNEQATTKAIKNALADISGKATDEDLVLLYFSTHGSSPSMDRSKIGSGYLVTYDTEVPNLYATAYGMDDLANFMRQKLHAERVVTILDTCYSGDTTRIMSQNNAGATSLEIDSLSSTSISAIAQGKGSVVITSSNNQEQSWESDEAKNSFFTLHLMNALRSSNGLANVKQLFTDLQRTIPKAVRSYTKATGRGEPGKGASQNPVIYPINNIPDIVIGTPVK